jgi:DNA-binding CsgD family transcriptional regulator
VLRLLLAEQTSDEIAGTLHLSPKTVANLHCLIKDKLGVGSDIELVRLALRQGILTQGDCT